MTTSISSSGSISSTGIGSGLDVSVIIDGLMKVEKLPLKDLTKAATTIQSTISAFGAVQSALATFRDAAASLALPSTFNATNGTSSDPSSVTVTTTANAAPGNYAVEVLSLAASQSTVSPTYASSATPVGAGSLHFDLGSWGGSPAVFNPKAGASGVDVAVSASDTLATVAAKVNAAGAGVSASVVNDSSGSRLVFSASTTGLANTFRITAIDADGGNSDATGLSALAYDPAGGTTATSLTQPAANASARINGLLVNADTNTLANVFNGIDITLGKLTTAPVQVAVAQDNTGIGKSVQGFVDAYNALSTLLAADLKYDLGTKDSGPLQGDSTARSLQNQLRGIVGSSSGASSVYSTLSQVGIQTAKDGTLSIDSTRLTSALANPVEIKKLFTAVDSAQPSRAGIANQLRTFGNSVLGINGIVSTRVAGLKTKLGNNQKNQDTLTDRLAVTEARLKAQYTALDKKMASITNLGTYVTQQIANWNKNTG